MKTWFLYGAFVLFVTFSATILWREDDLQNFPTLIISCLALGFSFHAYKFSKEKFRLDLLDRRWEIYLEVLKFCSGVMTHGGLPRHDKNDEERNESVVNALKAANASFRGMGYHKARSLFGPEIHEEFEKLNEAYAWLVSQPKGEGWSEKEDAHLLYVCTIIEKLPDLFRPYVYFGEYKNEDISKKK